MMASSAVHRLQILGAALLFSTGGAAIKACSLSSWQVASLRSGIAALALLLVLPGARRFWRPRTLLVGVAYACTMVLYVSANKLTTAANTIFLQSTAPMYVLLLGPWLLRERVRRRDLRFTLSLGFGMALFFIGSESPQATAPAPFEGNVLGAMAGLTWATTLVGLRWLGRRGGDEDHAAEASVIAGNLIACVVCLPMALPLGATRPLDWALVGYLGVFQIGLAYIFLARGVRRVPAIETSLLILLEPVLNSLWAWLVHGERPGPWSLVGCIIILLSTAVHTLLRPSVEPPTRSPLS
jgi:drug/metabolite transporter (DMT)-like permease